MARRVPLRPHLPQQTLSALPLLLLLLLRAAVTAPSALAQNLPPVVLRDVSRAAGLDYSFGPKKKYGGPSVADLDDDGYPDLLLTYHDKHFFEIYFNNRDGTFSKSPFKVWNDNHAINAFRYSPTSDVYFALSRGGANGRTPAHHRIFRVGRDRSIREVTQKTGITAHGGRGRSTLYLNLRGPATKKPEMTDILSLNAANLNKKIAHHSTFMNAGALPRFWYTPAGGYKFNSNWYAAVVDYNNDNRMDIASLETLRFHTVTGWAVFKDVTKSVLPKNFQPVSVVAVAELDFDNDGKWDLYVATTRTGDLSWQKKNRPYRDYLLRNVGGRYVDVTNGAGIPQDGYTRGVTVADIDNDGLIDIVVSKYWGRSLVLRNLGNGKFRSQNWVVPKRIAGPGDGVVAVDYDLDGRVDLVMGEGDGVDPGMGGFYRIFHNVSPRGKNHYLNIRVGSSPKGRATSLHALVRVRVGKTWMRRRVGANGVAVSVPLLETVHFGLGKRGVADWVVVRWQDGAERWLKNVRADQVLTMGKTRPRAK